MSAGIGAATTRLVARQPIFERDRRCVGYELLARNDQVNAYTATCANAATQQTVDVALHLVGLRELTEGRKAFINFTRDLLVDHFAEVLPPAGTVIEILENVPPDPDVVAACKRLKDQGFTLALDDFVERPDYAPLIDLADIIKIDFLATDPVKRGVSEYRLRRMKKELLAEKIESNAVFDEAKERGYHYFQGYFFCKPEIVARREITVDQQSYLRLLAELSKSEADFDRLEELIRQEPGLSLRLLSYLNSAAMGLCQRIKSIRHALALIGEAPLRRWAIAFAVTAIAADKPRELARVSLVRGRCTELLATAANMGVLNFDAFMTGLLSSLDVMLDRPMEEAIRPLPLGPEVWAALVGGEGTLGVLRRLILNLERAAWDAVTEDAAWLDLSTNQIGQAYAEAVKWADTVVPV